MTEKMDSLKSDCKANTEASGGEHHRCLDIWTAKKIGAINTGLTRQRIDAYTIRKLRENLSYAIANSPFYKRKYSGIAQAGSSGRISLPGRDADFLHFFESLPFTTQEELRECGMEFLCVRPGEISRIVTLDTGGSTGAPKRVYFTEEDQHLTADYFQNGMQLLVSEHDTVLILMPAKFPGSIGKLLAKGLAGLGVKTVEYGLPQIRQGMAETESCREAERLLELIEREQVTSVVALPTHMRMLSEAAVKRRTYAGNTAAHEDCRDAGQSAGTGASAIAKTRQSMASRPLDMKASGENYLSAGHSHLKSVLLSAEYVPEEDVRFIERVFGCKAYEHYGMTEMGLGCAVSCGHSPGYHVREADLYLEIIDPETKIPVRDGALGEIVFTTLTRKGMPFIRYRTGDYSRWLTAKCSCGSLLKRLDKVRPRNVVKGYLR